RYQTEFQAVAAARNEAQRAWKAKADAARARGEEPPEPPKFQPGENRFFTEVSTAKGPLALPEKDKEKVFSEAGRSQLAILQKELKQLEAAAPPKPPMACGVAEGKIVEQHVFLRGNPESRGEIVPKRFPVVLAREDQAPITSGSGRRELAEWLADRRNPLTARVMVNRIWQWHFGEGIVRTPSNFGITGERPTHAELLDFLATRFVRDGWSVKSMHRLIMSSSAYQMSSEISPQQRQQDADDRLWSRFQMRRLTAEEIRDSLLWGNGSIDLAM